MQQRVYETNIHGISDLQKRLMQTWSDFEQDVSDAWFDQLCDRLKLCTCGSGHFEHLLK